MKSKDYQFQENLKKASTMTSENYMEEWVQETAKVLFQQDAKENLCICSRVLPKVGYYITSFFLK